MARETKILIMKVRQHSLLYDRSHQLYKNVYKKAEIWNKIGEEMNVTSDVVKAKWKNLRDCYIRFKRSAKSATGLDKKYVKWPWGRHMRFLDDTLYLRSRRHKTVDNLSANDEAPPWKEEDMETNLETLTSDVSNISPPVLDVTNMMAPHISNMPQLALDVINMQSLAPDVISMKTLVPDILNMQPLTPDVLNIQELAPDISNSQQLPSKIQENAPNIKKLPSNILNPQQIGTDIPNLQQLTSAIVNMQQLAEDVSNLKQPTPDVSNIKQMTPDVSKIQQHSPAVSNMQKLPSASLKKKRLSSTASNVQKLATSVLKMPKLAPKPAVSSIQRMVPNVSNMPKLAPKPPVTNMQRLAPIYSSLQRLTPGYSNVQHLAPAFTNMPSLVPSNKNPVFKKVVYQNTSSASEVEELNTNLLSKPITKTLDGIDHLFLSYADTLKKLRPRTQVLLKVKLARIFARADMTELCNLPYRFEHRKLNVEQKTGSENDDTSYTMFDVDVSFDDSRTASCSKDSQENFSRLELNDNTESKKEDDCNVAERLSSCHRCVFSTDVLRTLRLHRLLGCRAKTLKKSALIRKTSKINANEVLNITYDYKFS